MALNKAKLEQVLVYACSTQKVSDKLTQMSAEVCLDFAKAIPIDVSCWVLLGALILDQLIQEEVLVIGG